MLACDFLGPCHSSTHQTSGLHSFSPSSDLPPPTRLHPIRVMLPHVPAYQRPPPKKSRRHRNPARRKGAGARSSRLSTATARPVRFWVWIFLPSCPAASVSWSSPLGPGFDDDRVSDGDTGPRPLHDPPSRVASLPLPRAEPAPSTHTGRVERFMGLGRTRESGGVVRPHPGGEGLRGLWAGWIPFVRGLHHLPAHNCVIYDDLMDAALSAGCVGGCYGVAVYSLLLPWSLSFSDGTGN